MSESDEDDATVETTVAEAVTLEESPEPDPPIRSRPHRMAITLAGVLAACVALSAWLYFAVFRVDRELGPEAEQAVMTAAADGAIAVLTYSPKTLEQDFANAASHLTGEFLSYYTDFTQNVVTPAAKQKDVQTVASVVRRGVISLHPTTAEVLVFVNQTTISKANPDGSFSMSSVKVGLQKHDGRWLISTFDPV